MINLHPRFIKTTKYLLENDWRCIGYTGATWFFRNYEEGLMASCDALTGETRRWTPAGQTLAQIAEPERELANV